MLTPLEAAILREVPPGACRILHVHCGDGHLAAALKAAVPNRTVFGIAGNLRGVYPAPGSVDRVWDLDPEYQDIGLPPQSLDCIIYDGTLPRCRDPEQVLRRHCSLLAPGGCILATIPNVQHHSMLTALLSGDWEYGTTELLSADHVRLLGSSTAIKIFLDAGLVPQLLLAIEDAVSPAFLQAVQPLLTHLGLNAQRARFCLGARHYLFRAWPIERLSPTSPTLPGSSIGPAEDDPPISFVVCTSDEASLRANLLSSPCFRSNAGHEVIVQRRCPSAADGLNAGLAQARHAIVVCLHQDVYLPCDWPKRFVQQWRVAEARFGKLAIAGVYGIAGAESGAQRTGHVFDRVRPLWEPPQLPARVDTLDELLLAFPRGTPLRFDPRLGFHFYGADICLQAASMGQAAVVLDALCFHNSRSVGLAPAFFASGQYFTDKWRPRLPIATSCVQIAQDGAMQVW